MITGGHIAASYLLSQTAASLGISLSSPEVIQIIVVGNIIDIDFLVGLVVGKTGEAHHQSFTHTPFGALILWGISTLVLQSSLAVAILLLASLLLHLVLDDIGYWFYKLKLVKAETNPQINWLYPFRTYHKNKLIKGNMDVLKFYLIKAWPVALLELLLILTAIILLIKH